MAGAITLIISGKLQGNLDCSGFKLIGLDASNLGELSFGPQTAHHVFCGPTTGVASPTFRLMTPDEFGAQPQSAGLNLLSPTVATNIGLSLLQAANLVVPKYPRATGGSIPYTTWVTPEELRSDIVAQPLNTNLTNISALSVGAIGLNILDGASTDGGYSKFSSAGTGNTVSFLTSAQLAADLRDLIIPFFDDIPHVKNKAAPTKQFRINCASITAGQTRVMTIPDFDFTPATIDKNESLINKLINGLTLRVGNAATDVGAITYTQTPAQPIQLAVVDFSGIGTSVILRASAPADVVVPVTGTLATTANIASELLKHIASAPPGAADSPGVAGQTSHDDNFEYRCTATDTWKRVAISSW